MAYGYEVSVTPMQLMAAYDAIVNDGILRRPRLIDAILDESGEVLDVRTPVAVRRVCSVAAARSLRSAMIETVNKGTAKRAAIPGFEVGGKTGTAQRYDPKLAGYAPGQCNLSFFGFVQSAQRIELEALVVVEDPKVPENLEFAGTMAAPLFRRIATRVLEHRGATPNPEWIRKPELVGR